MQTVILEKDVRVFKSVKGSLIGKTGYYLETGDVIHIGDVEIRCFDHQDKRAYPFQMNGEEFFLLEEEVKPSLPVTVISVQ